MKKTLPIILFVISVVFGPLVWLGRGYLFLTPEAREFERLIAQEEPPVGSEKRKIAQEAARKFKDKYANLKYLSFNAEIYEIPKSVNATADVTMRPEFFTTNISFDGQPVWELMFKDGKFYEHKLPFNGGPEESFVSEVVDRPDGPGNVQANLPFYMGCMIGGQLSTWVGPKLGYIISTHSRHLEESWFVGKETIDRHPCLVFFYRYPFGRVHKYYLDEESFLIRRYMHYEWYTPRWGEAGWPRKQTLIRVRTYHNIITDDPGSLSGERR
jgi:hypothetical protein